MAGVLLILPFMCDVRFINSMEGLIFLLMYLLILN